jgi:hypothetical protein
LRAGKARLLLIKRRAQSFFKAFAKLVTVRVVQVMDLAQRSLPSDPGRFLRLLSNSTPIQTGRRAATWILQM